MTDESRKPKLGIFSWNIQNNFNPAKFNEVSQKLKNIYIKEDNYPEFLALGFQEVDTPDSGKKKKKEFETFFDTLLQSDNILGVFI